MFKQSGIFLFVIVFVLNPNLMARAQAQQPSSQSPATSQAASPPPLTLADAIRTALARHPSLAQLRESIRAADARTAQAKAGGFPQISASAAAKQGLSGASGALGLRGLVTSPSYMDIGASVAIVQNLYDFGRTKHQVRAARYAANSYRPALEAGQALVTLNVEQAYYAALKQQRLIKVAEGILAERQLIVRQAAAFYKAELRSKADLTLAEVSAANAELELMKARDGLRTAFAELNNAMGVEGQSSYSLDDPQINVAQAPALDQLLAESQSKRPELVAIDAKIKSDEEIVAFYKSTKWPKLTGLFSGGLLRFSQLTPGKLLLGAFGFDFPIYTGGRIKNEIIEAQANVTRTQAARAELAQDIRFQVQRAYNELVSAGESVRGSEQVVRQAREALRLAQVRYRVQLGSFVELTIAETAASGAEAQYAEALYNYKVAETRLDYVAGRPYRP